MDLTSQFWAPEVRDKTRAPAEAVQAGGAQRLQRRPHARARRGAKRPSRQTLAVAEVAKAAGARTVIVNPDPIKERKTDEELAIQAEVPRPARRRLREREAAPASSTSTRPKCARTRANGGYELAPHRPQAGEVLPGRGLGEARRPGSHDAAARKPARGCGSLHLRSARQGVWMEEFGDGDVDYREVAAYLKEIGFQGYLVVELAYEKETRITRPLEENLKRSREYAEKIFL